MVRERCVDVMGVTVDIMGITVDVMGVTVNVMGIITVDVMGRGDDAPLWLDVYAIITYARNIHTDARNIRVDARNLRSTRAA
eukprot:939084-Prorocentrum_minimum.AAC.1